MPQILLSDLAVEQLGEMPAPVGRVMINALQRLRTFPQSAPHVPLEGYELYRQLNVCSYRAIYRFWKMRMKCVYIALFTHVGNYPSQNF